MSPAHEIPVVQLSYIFLNTYKYGITAQCRLTLLARPNMYANCKKRRQKIILNLRLKTQDCSSSEELYFGVSVRTPVTDLAEEDDNASCP